MLNQESLLKYVEPIYEDMLKSVNIIDFYKCMAQFAGIKMNQLDDLTMKNYLWTWAKNKYRLYVMLGNRTRLDTPFEYERTQEGGIFSEIRGLCRDFPVYSYWLENFENATGVNMSQCPLGMGFVERIKSYFPSFQIKNSTIPHFLKSCLNAPDELVTRFSRIFENQEIKATHTISIDPVDMLLASENPYGWTSCYSLKLDRTGSHADGCVAAMLDDSSVITYIWNRSGKFTIYNKYTFTDVRYKRMRQWVSISKQFTTLHFNEIYPGKDSYDKDFKKKMRTRVEDLVAKYLDAPANVWGKRASYEGSICRKYRYGYGEFHNNLYVLKGMIMEEIEPYNERIFSPDGVDEGPLPGSDDWDYRYNGQGFVVENYEHICDEDDEDWYDDEEEYENEEEAIRIAEQPVEVGNQMFTITPSATLRAQIDNSNYRNLIANANVNSMIVQQQIRFDTGV